MMKKIKKGIIILLGLFLIPSFSSAYEIIDQGKVSVDIPSNFSLNSKDYSFNYYGNITTNGASYFEWKNYNGNFYLDYLYGWIDGKLYFYSYESESNRTSQGFVNSFWKTNNLISTRNFNYSATDFYNLNPDITKIVFGNDSTSITYSDKYRTFYLCFFNNNDSYYYCAGGAPILWYEQEKYSTFTGSLGFLSVDNAKDGNWGTSPLTPAKRTPDTNDVCITVQKFFDIYGSTNNYNTGLCYTQDRYLTETGRVQVTPKFITELYPTYQEFRQDVNTRNNYCRPPATQQTCQQAFNGKEENRTLINKLQEGTDTAIIYDMCVIYQTRSGNMQKNFCDMTEEEAKKIGENTITTEKYAERIANNNTTITIPTTGTVYDGLTDGTNRDILEAIPRVYTKITGIFKRREGKNGIIPYYITGILLVIVLFKLFKK